VAIDNLAHRPKLEHAGAQRLVEEVPVARPERVEVQVECSVDQVVRAVQRWPVSVDVSLARVIHGREMPAGRSVLVDDVAHGLDDRLVGRVCRAELEEEEPVVHTEVEAGVGKEHTHHDSPAARAVGREPLEAAARELCSARDEARAHLAVLRPELIVGRQIDPALLANLVSEPAQRGLLCCVVVQSGHREPREVERARHMRVRRGQVVDEACLHARLELDEPGDEALEV